MECVHKNANFSVLWTHLCIEALSVQTFVNFQMSSKAAKPLIKKLTRFSMNYNFYLLHLMCQSHKL